MSRPKLSDDDVRHSFRWFSRQPESIPFMAALHSILDEIGPLETSALHRHDERRKFAFDLIAMAEAEKRDGPESNELERRNVSRAEPRKNRRHGPAGRA